MAALGDMPEVVRALLDAGAEINADDGHGLRPVHYAVSWDAQGALSVLLESGAYLRFTSKDQIFYLNKIIPVFVVGGRTPLHFAAEKVMLNFCPSHSAMELAWNRLHTVLLAYSRAITNAPRCCSMLVLIQRCSTWCVLLLMPCARSF